MVASLHVPSNNEADNTKRPHPRRGKQYVHMLGHLTGRLLLEREAYPVNQEAVIDACAETGTWIELNCNRGGSISTGANGFTRGAKA